VVQEHVEVWKEAPGHPSEHRGRRLIGSKASYENTEEGTDQYVRSGHHWMNDSFSQIEIRVIIVRAATHRKHKSGPNVRSPYRYP
jgi:hypothetical protein